ncbi:MAG: tetratricopeptide repeat protein [Planctomycetes bacterium]|nr:tetratricopeptide repeat protein [Planctomycetota bacterium]
MARRKRDRRGGKAKPQTDIVRKRQGLPFAIYPLILLVAGLAAYLSSFSGSFVFDDVEDIQFSQRIKKLWPITDILTESTRPVVELTLAVNHAVGELEVFGYHAVNLAIHLAAGLVLFGVVRRTLLLPACNKRFDRSAAALAFTIATIWTVHPLQTQSVTYIIQRAESLMGLCYLLTIYFVLRGAAAARPARWYVAAVVVCALGMGSKAVMVTAPLLTAIYDRAYLSASFKQMVRRRWHLYLGLMATWIVLGGTGILGGVFGLREGTATVGFAYKGITPFHYALTQPGVILHYLRLSVWPYPLCLDYGWPVVKSLPQALPWLFVLVVLLGITAWMLIRRPGLGFPAAWFFVILAPTSSIVPIMDVIFEHRMYLPLAGVVTLLVLCGHFFLTKLETKWSIARRAATRVRGAAILVLISGLVVATYQHNKVYRSDLALWSHVAKHRPQNARGHRGVGTALEKLGRYEEADRSLREAVRLAPRSADALFALGNVLRAQGRIDEAVDQYEKTIATNPAYARAYINLGNILSDRGQSEEAAKHFRTVIAIDSPYVGPELIAKAFFNLGNGFSRQGNMEQAIESYEHAVETYPGHYNAHYGLGLVFMRSGRIDEAIEAFRATLELEPNHRDARQALDQAMAQRGQ